jgi:hypothetical protein
VQLAVFHRLRYVDPVRLETPAVVRVLVRADDGDDFLVETETFAIKRREDIVLLGARVEECADVTRLFEPTSAEGDRMASGH